MPTKLFETSDRDEAHRKLEEVLGMTRDAEGHILKGAPLHASAECREDHSKEKPYQIWDGPEERPDQPSPAPVPTSLDALATLVAEKLAAKLKSGVDAAGPAG